MKDGFGKYFYQNGERYFGTWKNNMKDGEGTLYLIDGSFFKGLALRFLGGKIKFSGYFKENKKDGKGELHANGVVCIEDWENGVLKGSFEQVLNEDPSGLAVPKQKDENKDGVLSPIPKERSNDDGRTEEHKADMEPIKEISKEYDENLTSEAKNNYDATHSQMFETEANLVELEAHLARKYESKFESSAEKDMLSEMKSELNTLNAGYDTLTLIEQIELYNSINSSFLNKNSKFGVSAGVSFFIKLWTGRPRTWANG